MANSGSSRRAVSEVVGFVLVFTLVLSSVTLVSVVGIDVLSVARNAEQAENAERAFGVLAENVESVAAGEAPRRATEIDLADASLATVENVTVNVTATGSGARRTVKRQVRPLHYTADGPAELYYEAGALIRVDRNGSIVHRAPAFVVDDERAVVQVLAMQSEHRASMGSSTVRVVTTATNRTVDVADRSGTFDRLLVNVTSPRRGAWESLLTDAGFGSCRRGTDAAGDAFVTCERTAGGGYGNLYVSTARIELELDR